jgi:hypothetical protein
LTACAIIRCSSSTSSGTSNAAPIGGGWIAEEALSIALYACLCARDFEYGLTIAATHSGDSDSTGAIAGNGLPLGTFPAEIPYRAVIRRPPPPLFLPKARSRAVRFDPLVVCKQTTAGQWISRINHHRLWNGGLGGETFHHSGKNRPHSSPLTRAAEAESVIHLIWQQNQANLTPSGGPLGECRLVMAIALKLCHSERYFMGRDVSEEQKKLQTANLKAFDNWLVSTRISQVT